MARTVSLNDALAILQQEKDKVSTGRDEELKRTMQADCKQMLATLESELLGPAERAAKQAERDVVRVERSAAERSTPVAKLDGILGRLQDGAVVAVLTMLGSLCPITLSHTQCYTEARRIILGDAQAAARRPQRLEHFDECVGLVWLNGDGIVGEKLRSKGQRALNYEDRRHLAEIATRELPWLCFDEGRGCRDLRQRWPRLSFQEFDLNGADDVVKYQKWRDAGPKNRMITIGRPGSTAAVVDGMRKQGIGPDDETCFLGPELPDISSTAARDASMHGDRATLLMMLHPAVADWLLQRDGHSEVAGNRLSDTSRVAASSAASSSASTRPASATRASTLSKTGSSVVAQRAAAKTKTPTANKTSSLGVEGRSSLRSPANKTTTSMGRTSRSAARRSPSPSRGSARAEALTRRPASTGRAFRSGTRNPKSPSSGSATAAEAATDGPELQHNKLVREAWSLVLGRSEAAPPLSTQDLREQLRSHLVETDAEALPIGAALSAVDALLRFELEQKTVTDAQNLERLKSNPRIALWQGDITTLRIGAIVNAANEKGLGCFQPDHRCIDNVIHCAAGPRLRQACALGLKEGPLKGKLPTGEVLLTPAFSLPCDYVAHVPGPQIFFGVEQPEMLTQCYRNVLEACKSLSVSSVAFCCISTGLFGYPAASAAKVALSAVRTWLDENSGGESSCPVDLVVFNTFLESDLNIYKKLLELS